MRMPRFPVRYLGWMVRDTALGPGLVYLALGALFSYLGSQGEGPGTADMAGRMLQSVVGQFSWIVVLIAGAGIVANDVGKGYYRSMFAEPVSPAGYYLQRWLVSGVAVASFVPLVGLGAFVTLGHFPFSAQLLLRLMLLYLLLGGLIFLLSTVLRADWLIALLVFILQSVLQATLRAGAPLGPIMRGIANGLPPFQIGSATASTYPTAPELTHALLYGAAMVLTAVLILSNRPMGSGGRA